MKEKKIVDLLIGQMELLSECSKESGYSEWDLAAITREMVRIAEFLLPLLSEARHEAETNRHKAQPISAVMSAIIRAKNPRQCRKH